jgi:hypothetical protein
VRGEGEDDNAEALVCPCLVCFRYFDFVVVRDGGKWEGPTVRC